ncbi:MULTISPECIES: serine hydrolase domain-containing protein [Bradyrhizobium]|uniref:CubicO group peptidase (Beta-lactamase class C family) n=1 Tax=Bradyrhizobium ottawaense TaxID=931866 RepID=A0ABV4G7X1_9BRAD|nr:MULTISPECIES: serine hydrolase domain-containing protein [Bradyrhizobium]MBR1289463.1 serine hydrolase [Bradyrhizobium ottawaense]MBR1326923.1 serine hydrolase [Bradyrhizobium ottawaense]MBR1331406.1 serine hydrolase [Bradyrhizobium ottawaense]MBR1361956.1 serine hydrolase [Bradyrhizobium ottawaense]MDA9419362.1 penicillin-binding protein [Bradyrhizobium sp. CCBAU 25360]
MRRRRFISLLGAAALAPLSAPPVSAEPSGGCGVPLARDDGWPAGSVNDDGLVNRDVLCRMGDRLASSDANIHAVLVARDGKLAFERYFKGADEIPGYIYGRRVETIAFDADTLHNMKSVSKSVASLVVGIAIDRGLIRGVNEPIFSFFPELSDLRSPEKDRIRLAHVLTMSMGLKWVEATPATGDDDNDETRMHMAWDPCRYVLGLPVTAAAGQEFFYNTGALTLVSAIIRKATGRPLDEFARENLFEPLGITGTAWGRYRGDTDAGGGLRLRPRDMAKIGQLVLAGGRWNDRQIVSKAWIEASTAEKIKATDDQSYGYLWWRGQARLNDRKVAWVGALGRGGQSIRIVPELDLVVAVTAGYYQDYSPKAFQLQFGIFRDVLRAIPPPA